MSVEMADMGIEKNEYADTRYTGSRQRDMSASKKVSKALKHEVREFCGKKVRIDENGYLCATDACKAVGKKLNNYTRNEQTLAFLKKVSSVTRIRVTELIVTIQGGTPGHQGTWVHPRVAIHLAQWLSPEFAVKVTDWVSKFLKGDISHARETIERHGAITSQAEADEMKELRDKLFKLEIKAEEDGVLLKEKDIKIDTLQKTINEMNGKLDRLSTQNDNLLRKNDELLREAQDANDNIGDLKDYVVAQSKHRAHMPANDSKREVLLIFRANDPDWNYYISRVKENGIKRSEARAHGQFPRCELIRTLKYVPNARHMLEELEAHMGDRMYRRSCRVRLADLEEREFLSEVDDVYTAYVKQAEDATE